MMSRHVINSSFYVNEKRNETWKRSFVWFLVGCVFCATYILYCTVYMMFTRDGTRKFPKYRKKRSTSSECKVQKWIWSGCTAAMCLKRVQSPHGNDSNGNNNGEVREEKENPGAFFLGT